LSKSGTKVEAKFRVPKKHLSIIYSPDFQLKKRNGRKFRPLKKEKFNIYFATGAAPVVIAFSGTALSSVFLTMLPEILSTTGEFLAFESTVTDLLIGPTRLVSYFTLMVSFFPGRIGSLGQLGTVQPQDDLTLERIRGSLPVLVNSNSQFPSPPTNKVP
jgi:hypothetical protein